MSYQADEIRQLLQILENKNNTVELDEGFWGNLWDRIKAGFGSDESAGRIAIKATANRHISAFRKYIGPRREQIQDEQDFNNYLIKFLKEKIGFDQSTIEKVTQHMNIDLGLKKQDQKPEQKSNQTDQFDMGEGVTLRLRNYLKEDILMEDKIGMSNDELQKFFVALINMAQDDNKQPKYVQQALEQELEKAQETTDNSISDVTSNQTQSTSTTRPSEKGYDPQTALKTYSKLVPNIKINTLKQNIKSKKFPDVIKPTDAGEENPLLQPLAAAGYSFLRTLG